MPHEYEQMRESRKKIVFLGTPEVAARVLEILLESENLIQVVAVVSQAPARSSRKSGLLPSPVHTLALKNGIAVLTPNSAKDHEFLADLAALEPDLCITAAYGNVLPDAFLALPKYGTLNIHPSLLPLYRGAAPVQRTLEDGADETGVSIAFTVKAMDAGPVLAQPVVKIDPNIKTSQLLLELFELGARTLVDCLPSVFLGQAKPWPQDATQATRAKKIAPNEGNLDFSKVAKVLHNQVRAFSQWPGTRANLVVDGQEVEIKVCSTRIGENRDLSYSTDKIMFANGALVVLCGSNTTLEILELQIPGKRIISARDFWNGLTVKNVIRPTRKVESDL